MRFEQPFFVTPHAVRAFQTRVCPGATAADAIRQVQAALQDPIACPPGRDGAVVFLCELPNGKRFGAVVKPAPDGLSWPVVTTTGQAWMWHEFNRYQKVPGKRQVIPGRTAR